jgi:hypothetical protein
MHYFFLYKLVSSFTHPVRNMSLGHISHNWLEDDLAATFAKKIENIDHLEMKSPGKWSRPSLARHGYYPRPR